MMLPVSKLSVISILATPAIAGQSKPGYRFSGFNITRPTLLH